MRERGFQYQFNSVPGNLIDSKKSSVEPFPFLKLVPKKIRNHLQVGLLVVGVVAAACRDGDDKSASVSPTAIPETPKVQRIVPTETPTQEPTNTPKPEPTFIAKPTAVTKRAVPATATEKPKPTVTQTREVPTATPRPTLTPLPTRTLIPTIGPRLTSIPRPTITPAPTPTLFPQLEACNMGKFINPVDGQEIPTRVDVRAELAHDGNYDLGCKSPTGDADVILIDTFGNQFKWDLYCFDTSPNPNDDSNCHRERVILADFSGRRWDMELKIEDLLLEKISVVIE